LRRPEGARAREYLAGRGLNEEMISKFRIGYAPDSGFLLRDRLKAEFSEEVLSESGLFSWREEERLPASGARLSKSDQPSDVRPQPDPRSLDSARDDNAVDQPTTSNERPTTASMGNEKPEAGSRKPETASMYSKFRNRVMFP